MMDFLKRILSHRARQYYVFFTFMLAIPFFTLVGMGYCYLWDHGWLLQFSLGLLGLALISMLLHYLIMQDQAQVAEQSMDNQKSVQLKPLLDWSIHDTKVWEASLINIKKLELSTVGWRDLPDAMLKQLAFVADNYHQNTSNAKYAFTIPEMLLMLEVVSRKYRGHVLENVPLSQNIKVSTIMGVSETSSKSYKVYKQYSLFLDTLRGILSAGSSVPGQIASKLGAELAKKLTDHMQQNMKQLLFEEVTQVAINLYSGRLKLSDEEMCLYRKSLPTAEEAVIRPLSVMVVGQVNAGKSSLINVLKEQSVAEVDVLPSTAGFYHYNLPLSKDLTITLIDSPGLDGNKHVANDLLEEAIKADLLIWISQANQPAKLLDKKLLDEWDHYFDKNLRRKKPPVLLVTTHNDMLKPQGSWHPPYDLNDMDDKKAQAIVMASRYTRETLGLKDAPVIPISLKPGEVPYNIDALRDILFSLSTEARAAQLNRERFDASDRIALISKALSQTVGLASKGIKLIFR
jgi:predicted GTPase